MDNTNEELSRRAVEATAALATILPSDIQPPFVMIQKKRYTAMVLNSNGNIVPEEN